MSECVCVCVCACVCEGKTESGPQGHWGQDRQAQMKDNLWRSLTAGGEAPVEHAHSDIHTHTHTLYHTLHTAMSLSFSPVSSPSSSLSLPFLLLSLKSTPPIPLVFFFQHSCSWISKDTWPAEKAECLAGRSLSQAGWDCGIPASHSLGTVFAPSGAPAITASGLLLHLHLQLWARALFANWAWQKIMGSQGEERSNVWDGVEQQQLPVVASVFINYHSESS